MKATVCGPCADRLEVSYDLVQRCARGQQELQRRLDALRSEEVLTPLQRNVPQPQACAESDSDSNPAAPLTFQRLEPLEPDVTPARPTTPTNSPARCRHNLSSSLEGECDMCGSLDVLAAAVERMRGFESSHASTSTIQTSVPTDPAQTTTASTSSTSGGTKRKLACDFCGKAFHHTGDLNKHRRCHTGERPYWCLECGKKFAHVSNLLRHRKLHSGERPFTCSSCERSFSRSDKLVSHNCPAARAGRSSASTSTTPR
ncbi:hypothetical protein B566_EDAN003764 [Ephemera danica]|nr:hypothetical protein B566_EDAN003764 [Ephemera danica]